jgi:hypothetical protein
MLTRTSRLALWLFVLIGLAGCGPATGTVTGEVTVNGVPLEEGVITFSPADKNGESVTREIKAGKYEAKMVAGNKFVQISAPIVIGTRKESTHPNAPLIQETEEGLPARYNSESELTFEVKSGTNTKNWNLEKNRKP